MNICRSLIRDPQPRSLHDPEAVQLSRETAFLTRHQVESVTALMDADFKLKLWKVRGVRLFVHMLFSMTNCPRLTKLVRDMRFENERTAQFEFRRGTALFKVVLILDGYQARLLFGLRGTTLAFSRQLRYDPKIDCYWLFSDIEDRTVKTLLYDALGYNVSLANKHALNPFFEAVDQGAPISFAACKRVEPHEYPRTPEEDRHEDPDSRIFKNWKRHDGIASNPTPENLAKTRYFFGEEVYRDCRTALISSCWTSDPARGKPATPPPV